MQFVDVRGIVFVLFILILNASACLADGEKPEDSNANRRAFVNATLHTMDGSPYVGSLLIRDGKIEDIGADVEIPAGVETVDLKGYHITPGLIESRGKLWLTTAAIQESSSNPTLKVLDGVNPYSEDWKELAAQGITSVYVQPNSKGTLGGYGSVLRVGPHGSTEKLTLKKDVGIQASIGISAATSNARYAQVMALKKKLESAKEKKKKEDEKKEAKKETSPGKTADKKDSGDKPKKDTKESKQDKEDGDKKDGKKDEEDKKKEDPAKVALRRVLSREIPLHVEVHHSDAVKHLIQMAKELKIRIVLSGLSQATSSAAEILESGFPVTVGPLAELGTPPTYRKNASYAWLKQASDNNALWSLGSFSNSPRTGQQLRFQTAMARQLGAGHSSTLAAVTSQAARMLGVSDLVGTLAKGKQADLAVFAGDPLDPATEVRMVLSHGVTTYESKATPSGMDSLVEAIELPAKLPAEYCLSSKRIWNGKQWVPGAVMVKDGKIQKMLKKAPKKTINFDVGEAAITPGLVVAQSSLGQGSTLTDTTESDMSHLRAGDAFNPMTKSCRHMLAGGFVHVGVSPSATATSAGAIAHFRLGTGDCPNSAIANLFGLANESRNRERFPASLPGQIQLLNEILEGGNSDSSIYVSSEIADSLMAAKQSALQEVKSGKRMAMIAASTDLEIRSAIKLLKDHGLKGCLRTRGRITGVAEELAAEKIGLIVPSFNGLEYREQVSEIVTAINSGVAVGFAGDSPLAIRGSAAMLAGAGANPTHLINGLTNAGADMIGMKSTGLEKSSPADLVIWSGSPLNLSAKPLAIIVDGQQVTEK